ncbi:hypothetical protein VF14_13390 [Nostoc linckia z18]|uniref:Uncharacterized protein n=2 Tax=Nostoc linckia TaxID=92942 RepID=A0A9Q6ELC9_NOSLI|nr:hypothetical protein [Nostoc linckia]PHK42285.1 hypothetical protein VF12_03775 [Nostoc linckia z15]PHK45493.1 hypothetical protein VF13_16225 [Nostoc linckia z16]PHJ59070.1 hypothetical protein VF02_26210 [Nostoc linckia z1]PHJ61923.1 hypothetical protein VF05_27905 [Nostoc linckia z3]PHJ67840.1 hypothetical protein VF03_25655 [Nostoc linckia z2]
MILTESEIQQVLEQVQAAFPNLADWEYNNEKNEEYFGFSVWGEFVIKTEELVIPRRFFITLDTNHEDKWQGCLTIGLHSYLWSSADVGDAHLVDTDPSDTLEEAIAALKAKISELFQVFLAGN